MLSPLLFYLSSLDISGLTKLTYTVMAVCVLLYGLQKMFHITFFEKDKFEDTLDIKDNSENNKPNMATNRSKAVQESIIVVQSWNSFAGFEDLSAFSDDNFHCVNDNDFAKTILLELFTSKRSQRLQIMIDFLHDDNNKSSRLFAKSLAHLIILALDLSLESSNTLSSITDLICVSPDSFIFDFVIIALSTANNNDKAATSLISPAIRVSPDSTLDRYNTFIYSRTPSIGKIGLFFSNIPIINCLFASCEIIKSDDMLYLVLKNLTTFTIQETQSVQEELCKISSSLLLPGVHGRDNDHEYGSRLYHSLLSSIKSRMKRLLLNLDTIDQVQAAHSLASSPLISPCIEGTKLAHRSLIDCYKRCEMRFLQYERAFVVFKMCIGDIIPITEVKLYLLQLSEIAQSRVNLYQMIHQMIQLKAITQKNVKLAQSLRDVLSKSSDWLNDETSLYCEAQTLAILQECEEFARLYESLSKIWKTLLDIIISTQQGLSDLEDVKLDEVYLIKNYEKVNHTLRHIQNDVFAVVYYNYISFLDNYKENMIQQSPFKSARGDIASLYERVADEIISYVAGEIMKLKSNIQKSIQLMEEFKMSQQPKY